MKIEICDINVFKPAHNISLLITLLRKNYLWLLKLKYPNLAVRVVSGLESVRALRSNRVIICPNHPTSMDTDMAFLLSTILKEELYFLTAREVFIGSFLNKYLLQLFGCFSVLRGTSDSNSFKYSVRVLQAGLHKLVIFPEGEICRRNDTLLSIKPGPAHIACTAVDWLNTSGQDETVYIVPVAFRYGYSNVPMSMLLKTMSSIEKALSVRSLEPQSLTIRMMVAAEIVLQELLAKYGCSSNLGETFSQRVAHARSSVLSRIAFYINFKLDPHLEETDQIHRLFVHLYKARWYEHHIAKDLDHQSHTDRYALLTEMIRDLFRVGRFISIGKTSPLRDRNDDINDLMLLRCEVLGDRRHIVPSSLEIAFGRPIDVRTVYSGKKEARLKSVLQITELVRAELETTLAGLIKLEPEIRNHLKGAFTP
jgi:1-acyl-sn-glycerol-3-phosphate acyltransferase